MANRRNVLRGAAAATAAAVGATSAAGSAEAHAGGREPTVKEPITTKIPRGQERYFDPYYNVVRGQVPASYHPWVANRQDRVLLYTRTAGPRHAHLGPALPAGLNPPLTEAHVLQNAIVTWMNEAGVQVDWTEDVTLMPGIGSAYKAVVFGSTSRDTLFKHGTAVQPNAAVNTTTPAHLDAARTALRQYMRAGGGFVGIHNAIGGTEYNWPYYEGLCGGTQYYDHGANQNGTVITLAKDSSTRALPPRWEFKDEWYNWMPFPTRVKFLLAVDEASLATKSSTHPGHGKFHPISWCQYYDGGRSWVTALGHDAQAYIDGSDFPGQNFFKKHVVDGILSTMGKIPFCG
ncbi:glycosyl hydrolase [Paractinoplanes deccanensis]|uniref:Glycosyl hydrolase n=1 Tax=Paractinoplanes deccanensis TaxID=113561 RepID=A0ABQ3YA89_9ACTN|nr:ThuA domain-containing protein [Actinoplanes deccanensis]GID76927.1 glycosyl hydrolase [Actinoplanes deccanensis]